MTIAEQIAGFRVDDCIYPAGGTLGPREQTSLQLFYVYSGHCDVFCDGLQRRVGAGEVALLLPDHVELFRFARDRETHHGYCSALEAVLSDRQRLDYGKLSGVFPLSGKIRELTDWAKSLNTRTSRPAANLHDQIARLLFCEFFCLAAYPEQPAPLPEAVARARDLVLERFSNPLDLAALAKAACITPTHLVRLFRQHLAMTPVEYLWRIRTENGRRLLVETGLGVAEVAYRCGFGSSCHFSRRFKALYGATPKNYRRGQWMRS